MNKRKTLSITALAPALGFALLVGVIGCGNTEPAEQAEIPVTESNDTQQDADGMSVTSRTGTLKKIFHAAPSPVEMAKLIHRSGATFDSNSCNDPASGVRYNTSDRQAINLGVYGADLSYSTIFEENSASLEYLNIIKELSNQLGISDVITDDVLKEAEANRGDRKALISIVSDTFYDLNERLKSNGTEDLAGMLVAAGWVEGMYLATQHMDEAPAELKTRIAEQKMTLDDVMRLCKSYEATPELSALLTRMETIEAAFAGVSMAEAEGNVTQEDENTFVLGGGDEYTADDATIAAIAAAVAEVRTFCIQ
jgi:hypothetical protein